MVKHFYGVIFCAAIASNVFGMEKESEDRQNLQNVSKEELQKRLDENIEAQAKLDARHGDAWWINPEVRKQYDDLMRERKELIPAVAISGAPLGSITIRSHDITDAQPVMNMDTDNTIPEAKKSRIDDISESKPCKRTAMRAQITALEKELQEIHATKDDQKLAEKMPRADEIEDELEQLRIQLND
jgi:hypothetical protein